MRLAGLDRRPQRRRRRRAGAPGRRTPPACAGASARRAAGRPRRAISRPAGGSSGTSNSRPMAPLQSDAWRLAEELQEETARSSPRLIRFNTVNPPGDERECQEWLAGYLEDAGLDVRAARRRAGAPEPRRAAARRGDGPVLGYLSHVDTVLADAEDWTADPWGGELRDGFLYGRGAIDMKYQTAAEAVAAARAGAQRRRAARGDAEDHQRRRRGDRRRARRAVDHRGAPGPRARRLPAQRGRRRGHALRRPPPVRRLRAPRRARSASTCARRGARRARLGARPGRQRAAQARAADRARSASGQPGFDLTEATRALLEALGEDPDDPAAALERVAGIEPRLAPMLDAALRVTFAPTIVSRRREDQRHPGARRAARRLPRPAGDGRGRRAARVREVLGDDGYELEFTEEVVGNRSPVESPLMDAIGGWVGEHDPRRRGRARPSCPPSPTAAGSAPPSRTASPTASSRSATRRCTRPGR